MIDIFKSPNSDKVMIAIYPDCGFSVSNAGEVGLIVGPSGALVELRIALDQAISPKSTSMRDTYPTVAKMCDAVQKPNGMIKSNPAQYTKEIMELSASGLFPKEIASRLGLKFNSVRDLIYRERREATKASKNEVLAGNVGLSPEVVESPAIEPIRVLKSSCETCKADIGLDAIAIGGKIYCKACAPGKPPAIRAKHNMVKGIDEELLELIAKGGNGSAANLAEHLDKGYGYDITASQVSYYRGLITKRKNAKSKSTINDLGLRVEPIEAVSPIKLDIEPKVPEPVLSEVMAGLPEIKGNPVQHTKKTDDTIQGMLSMGRSPIDIADYINRHVGGGWTDKEVKERIKELRGDKQ